MSSDGDAQAIQAKLEEDLKQVLEEVGQDARQRAELVFLRAENDRLRKILANNESELVGAKLAAKYLDKELAGRCVPCSPSTAFWGHNHVFPLTLN